MFVVFGICTSMKQCCSPEKSSLQHDACVFGFFANLSVQQITTLKINILGHVPGNVPSLEAWRMTTARSALLLVLFSR